MTRFEGVRRATLKHRSPLAKAVVAALFIAVATAVRWLLGDSAVPVPFVTYFPAVLLAALFLDWRWGVAVTLGAILITDRLFLHQDYLSDGITVAEAAILLLFFLSSAVIIAVGDTLRRAVHELDLHAQDHELLATESFHRIQNSLTMIEAFARLDPTRETETLRRNLIGRLHALARANQLLRDRRRHDCDLRQLVADAVEPFAGSGAITANGPDCTVASRQAEHLTLILHELGTNAVKYGALSSPAGTVAIAWQAEQGRAVRLDWEERGGPAVVKPARRGFGTRLIERQTSAHARLEFAPEGLRCSVRIDPPEARPASSVLPAAAG